ncbi:hypothetical protein FHS56_000567 [Thermonema lapsum]|uniref:PNPLA domain-containing protein n=1 Tax=Thermonema lapsum TaxID=28195 RepID=A0A846MNP8_9BACT|nr:patatin-like phospholipase family protein [Thermonema lapsum]NIK73081.1 hypothetical protein [Thermonema lapsum]
MIKHFWQEWVVSRLFYSMPVQLLLLQLRSRIALVSIWVFLSTIVTRTIGMDVGLPYLLLEPEYLNRVDFLSMFIVGITLGGFIMSYHIACYILDGLKFPFIAHSRRPFFKFSINNSLLPFSFLIIYIGSFIEFQQSSAFASQEFIGWRLGGLLLGTLLMCSLFFVYFFLTNKDIFKISQRLGERVRRFQLVRMNLMGRYKEVRKQKIRVDYYLDGWRWQKVSEGVPVSRKELLMVFDQNHFNSIVIQSTVFLFILFLGNYSDSPYFQIPAGASLFLLLTILTMALGAFTFWTRHWASVAFLLLLIGAEILVRQGVFSLPFQAYGLNYDTAPAPYNLGRLREINSDSAYVNDYRYTRIALENWRKKFPKDAKPKLVVVCVSGGGLRAALWAFRCLQYTDSTLNGSLMDHTVLITGASGGMVGAAYFRELYLRRILGEPINIYSTAYFNNLARDYLNPIIFHWFVNDMFLRFQPFDYKGKRYFKDRGYAWEEKFNLNTGGLLDKPLCEYKEPELLALVPMFVLSPMIANDGRRLYISPLPMSYLCVQSPFEKRFRNNKIKGVELRRLLDKQEGESLRFLSALRMNATFPYIAPNVKLPTDPVIEIMDAGLVDNYGISTAVRFLYVFRDWIVKNTSGVLIVAIRDSQKDSPLPKPIKPSLFERLFTPIRSIYADNMFTQDIFNDDLLEYAKSWYEQYIPFDKIEFQYVPISKDMAEIEQRLSGQVINPDKIIKIERAALSWHLTAKERESIWRTIYETRNQAALRWLEQRLMP